MTMDIHPHFGEYLIAVVIVPILIIGVKRARERTQELAASYRVRRILVRRGNIHRKRGGVVKELQNIDDATFLRMFRMPKHIFFDLESRIAPMLRAKRHFTDQSDRMAKLSSGSAVDTILLLAATIRWLAGGSLWDIAFMLRLHVSTIRKTKYLVCACINLVLKENIRFPTSEEGLSSLAAGFASIGGGRAGIIPNVVAAVDSVCVHRKAPTITKKSAVSAAFNRKGYFATSFLAFVDSKCRFLSVSMPCYSSSHDSTLFACSKVHIPLFISSFSKSRVQLGQTISNGRLRDKWLIVGDDAFVCKDNVITPYVRKQLSKAQRNYNYFLSMNRQVVERTFALWKWKWGLFWRPLLINDQNIKVVIETTCRLHNLCIDVQEGGSLADFVHHDDVFWQRVAPSSSYSFPALDFQPTYADAQTIAAVTGVTSDMPARTVRQRILQHVHDSGHQMPDVGLLIDPTRKNRRCGIRPGTQGQVRLVQVGIVGN